MIFTNLLLTLKMTCFLLVWSCVNVLLYLKTRTNETAVGFVHQFSFLARKRMVKFFRRGTRYK